MAELLFYLMAAGALAGAAGVVLSTSPMASVLSLLASLFALAVIYLLAGFQFLAAAQVLVYVGAILVLFLFVIMLLDLGKIRMAPAPEIFAGRRAALAVVIAALVLLVGLVSARATLSGVQAAPLAPRAAGLPAPMVGGGAEPAGTAGGIDRLELIAAQLFGRYSLAFEAASLLLLATMAAVIVLAKRQRGPAAPTRELPTALDSARGHSAEKVLEEAR
ncbi:MAG TPA: NADH-quinone oxidoreductase subunit J, partial [Thermohalobaculum sp.]|nr:NADH-quinone oxidoreductase subunit J [Thermohalobaculum sp.]